MPKPAVLGTVQYHHLHVHHHYHHHHTQTWNMCLYIGREIDRHQPLFRDHQFLNTLAKGSHSRGRLLPSHPACVVFWAHLVDHYVRQDIALNGSEPAGLLFSSYRCGLTAVNDVPFLRVVSLCASGFSTCPDLDPVSLQALHVRVKKDKRVVPVCVCVCERVEEKC